MKRIISIMVSRLSVSNEGSRNPQTVKILEEMDKELAELREQVAAVKKKK
ncbi:MAG: hypothetical protein H6863_06500 [Rhodospirillales bacterium]|nr:hypothetical protein [Rhodospirillales bacterium]